MLFANKKINCKEFMLHRICLMYTDVNSYSEKSCERKLSFTIMFRPFFLPYFINYQASLVTWAFEIASFCHPPLTVRLFSKTEKSAFQMNTREV